MLSKRQTYPDIRSRIEKELGWLAAEKLGLDSHLLYAEGIHIQVLAPCGKSLHAGT
jgi:hypothetical protein